MRGIRQDAGMELEVSGKNIPQGSDSRRLIVRMRLAELGAAIQTITPPHTVAHKSGADKG